MSARRHLESLGIAHETLPQRELVTLSYTLHGWHVRPSTPSDAPPITARVWLLAGLQCNGEYMAPERFGHPADLEDGGPPVDSVVLMAVLQRHFLPRHAPGWDDASLAAQLGLHAAEIARAQLVLDHVLTLPLKQPRPAPLGAEWWLVES